MEAPAAPAWSSLATSWSTTAAWNDAATSATRDVGVRRTCVTTAVLRPENEKSGVVEPSARGNRIASGSPVRGDAGRSRAARVAEAEEAGDLVEGLPGGVVDRLAEHAVAAVALHDQTRVWPPETTSDREGRLEVGLLEPRRVEVRLEVVHADVRQPGRRGRGPWPR